MTPPTNIPAFPFSRPETVQMGRSGSCKQEVYYEGMTLRDYFAGQALTGILMNPSMDNKHEIDAAIAYAAADAMLQERLK